MFAKILIVSPLFALISCSACKQQSPMIAAISYEHSRKLSDLHAGELASFIEAILSDNKNIELFLRAEMTPDTKYHWTHMSNGALWQALFDEHRTDDSGLVLQAFVKISEAIVAAIKKSSDLPWKERSNGILALSLGLSKCQSYLKTRSGLMGQLNGLISQCLKDCVGLVETESDFDKRLLIIANQLHSMRTIIYAGQVH